MGWEIRGRHGGRSGVSPPPLPASDHRRPEGSDAQAHQRGKRRPHNLAVREGRGCGAAAAAARLVDVADVVDVVVFIVGQEPHRAGELGSSVGALYFEV